MIFHAQGKRGGIHDAQAFADRFHRRQLGQAFGFRVGLGIIGIDAVHLGGLEQHVRADFDRPQRSGGISREIRICPCRLQR